MDSDETFDVLEHQARLKSATKKENEIETNINIPVVEEVDVDEDFCCWFSVCTFAFWALLLAGLLIGLQDHSWDGTLVRGLLISSSVIYFCYLFSFRTPFLLKSENWVSPENAEQFINSVIEKEPNVVLKVKGIEEITDVGGSFEDDFGGTDYVTFYSRTIPLEFEGWEDRTAVKFKAPPKRKQLCVVKIVTNYSLDRETQHSFNVTRAGVTNLPRPKSENANYFYQKNIHYSVPDVPDYVVINTNPDGEVPFFMIDIAHCFCFAIGCVVPYLMCMNQYIERKKWVNDKFLHSGSL